MADSNMFGDVAHHRKDVRIEDIVIIIAIEGETYQTLDWSFGGFRIGGYHGSIQGNTEFMVNGIGPDLGTIFTVRVDCKAIRVHDDRLSASFIELDSDVYDILEALMMRREKQLEKLKQRLPHGSLADANVDMLADNVRTLDEACKELAAASGDGKEELLSVYQEALKLRDHGGGADFGLVTAISAELCRFIEILDAPGPREVQAIKLHVESMKMVVAQKIKGTGGEEGEKILAGLKQVCEKLHA